MGGKNLEVWIESSFSFEVMPLVMLVFISSRVPLCFDLTTIKECLKDILVGREGKKY